MKTVFTIALLFLSSFAWSQAGMAFKTIDPKVWEFDRKPWESIPDTIIYMSLLEAARVEYWAQKGITSVPVIEAMEREIQMAEQQDVFNQAVLANCNAHKEEYRQKLEAVSIMYNDKASNFIAMEIDRDMWKKKAQSRGSTIWTIAGAAGLLLFGIAIGI